MRTRLLIAFLRKSIIIAWANVNAYCYVKLIKGIIFLHALVVKQTRNQRCNTQSCPYTWSSWSESIPCNASCGEGTRQLISTCNHENGTAVALCDSKY